MFHDDAVKAEVERATAELQAALDSEREARFRAEAGAAVMRKALEKSAAHIWGERSLAQWEVMKNTALSTDTGACLAAVVEEVRKMPCDYAAYQALPTCDEADRQGARRCARCKIVDASN
jgi:hypothetical protein